MIVATTIVHHSALLCIIATIAFPGTAVTVHSCSLRDTQFRRVPTMREDAARAEDIPAIAGTMVNAQECAFVVAWVAALLRRGALR